ncbi:unnamed protein product [Boreogadus saida]
MSSSDGAFVRAEALNGRLCSIRLYPHRGGGQGWERPLAWREEERLLYKTGGLLGPGAGSDMSVPSLPPARGPIAAQS